MTGFIEFYRAGTDMKYFLAAVFLALCAATANANIIYNVDRTLGSYTLAGTIETDGTVGVIAQDNIPLNSWCLETHGCATDSHPSLYMMTPA